MEAVLNEWQKTMMDLPAGLRQAYEMVKSFFHFLFFFLFLFLFFVSTFEFALRG